MEGDWWDLEQDTSMLLVGGIKCSQRKKKREVRYAMSMQGPLTLWLARKFGPERGVEFHQVNGRRPKGTIESSKTFGLRVEGVFQKS